jgi:ubiquinone/menaquinone biosynthesis C-methylase UbiE
MTRVCEALRYPVSRAYVHYYANTSDEIARFAAMARRHVTGDSVIAELGCGHTSTITAGAGACRLVVGMDLSPKVAESRGVDCRLRGDLYELPFADKSIDLAILRYVVEHLVRPEAALREVARVLRPGAKVLLLTPNRRHYVCVIARLTPHWFHRWFLARHGRFDEDVCPTLYRANTPRRLREVASNLGFRVLELELLEPAPGYLTWSWPSFLLGLAYERLVNRFQCLAGLRISILATLQKSIDAVPGRRGSEYDAFPASTP